MVEGRLLAYPSAGTALINHVSVAYYLHTETQQAVSREAHPVTERRQARDQLVETDDRQNRSHRDHLGVNVAFMTRYLLWTCTRHQTFFLRLRIINATP